MKKVTLFTVIAVFAMALIGCETTPETNSNNAIVVNDNANVNTNRDTNTNTNANASNREITREDFDKDKDRYTKEAKDAGSTIGQGANDLWLWTKVRSALLATDDLRESTINVDVENEVVTLKGTVGTAAQKQSAVKVAGDIEGVKSVKDMLKIDAKDSAANLSTDSDGKTDADKANTNN